MVRTQICLKTEEIRWLKAEAQTRGTSMAGLVRELIHRAANKNRLGRRPKRLQPKQFLEIQKRFPFVGCLKGETSIDVAHLDDYLYGEGDAS